MMYIYMQIQQYKKNQQGFLEVAVILLIALILLQFLGIGIDWEFVKDILKESVILVRELGSSLWSRIEYVYSAVMR